jgi:outer membrane receptor protein involved in Fe transport
MFGDTWLMPLNNPFLPAFFRNAICSNPLNNIDQATCDAAGAATSANDPNYLEIPVVVNRRLVEQGNRETEYLTDMFQFTVGTRGDITDNLSFDVFAQYGESTRAQTNQNWGLKSLLQQTLFANLDANGDPQCDPSKNPGPGCVPINLFGSGQDISEGTIAYWNKPNGVAVKTTLAAAIGSIAGEFDMPGFMPTDLPLGFAVGYEFRKYEASQNADVAASTQDEVLGTGSPDPLFSGEFDTSEFFLEAIMPLVSDKSGIQSLNLELGARSSDYSTSGRATTWKAGMTYEPFDGLKVRGIFQESSRSPNIFELFNPPTTGLNNLIFDPCQGTLADGVTPNPALSNSDVQAICIAQGAPSAAVTGGLIPPPSANQINETSGGNPNLDVETAESTTFGFVFTPDFVPELTVTVDYYNIFIEDAITTPTAGDIFNPCFGDGTAGSTFPNANPASPSCALIGRNPLNGSLNGGGDTLGLITQYTNQGTLETSGIDLRVTYDWELNAGVVSNVFMDLTYNHTAESLFQAGPNSINRECVGQYSENCDPSIPENSLNFRATAGMGEFGNVTLLWRWFSEMSYEKILDNPFEGSGLGGANDTEFMTMNAGNYFDLGYSKTFADMITVNLLVSNLFDEQPPVVGSFLGGTGWNSGNTYPSLYDVLGRRWSLTASVRWE